MFYQAVLLLVLLVPPTLAEENICCFTISGQYGFTSRYICYSLLFTGVVFHKIDWLVGATLAPAMLYTSVTSIHAIALASVNNPDILDLDTAPVFIITGSSLLACTHVLMWSRSFHRASREVRRLVFMWMGLMIAGIVACLVNSYHIIYFLEPGATTCTGDLRMREGQQPVVLIFIPDDNLEFMYRSAMVLMPLHVVLGLVCGAFGKELDTVISTVRLRYATDWKTCYHSMVMMSIVWATQVIAITIVLAATATMGYILVDREIDMMKSGGTPSGENITAVGQWSPLIGTFLGFVACLTLRFDQRGDKQSGSLPLKSTAVHPPLPLARFWTAIPTFLVVLRSRGWRF